MSPPPRPSRRACWPDVRAPLLVVALVIGVAAGAHADSRRQRTQQGTTAARKAPERPAPIPISKRKVAVFAFGGDDDDSLRAVVVRVLRAKGLDVITSLRPVDSAAQFREMADTLNLAVYVDGELRGDRRRESVVVRVRSGITGQRMASAMFYGDDRKIPTEVARTLWSRVGAAVTRACVAGRPRRHERAPMRIEAGTPIEDTPIQAEGT